LKYPVLARSLLGLSSFCFAQRIWTVDMRRKKRRWRKLAELSIVLRIVTEPFKRPLFDLSI
jgi:hypothetical protein